MVENFEHLEGSRVFDENVQHPDATADAITHYDFDWETVRVNLGEPKEGPSDNELAGQLLSRLLVWTTRGNRLDIIGRRAVALAWLVCPDLFEGDPRTRQLLRKVWPGGAPEHEGMGK